MMEGHRPTHGDRDTGAHRKAQSSMYGRGGWKLCPRAEIPPARAQSRGRRVWEGSGQGGPGSAAGTGVPAGGFCSARGSRRHPKGPSGFAAAAAAPAAATLHPHEAGLLLQDVAAHHLGQLLRVAPRVGRHLHPGAGQPPEHLLRAAALPQQLRVPPAGPAQQAPAERGEWAVGRAGETERQTDRQTDRSGPCPRPLPHTCRNPLCAQTWGRACSGPGGKGSALQLPTVGSTGHPGHVLILPNSQALGAHVSSRGRQLPA